MRRLVFGLCSVLAVLACSSSRVRADEPAGFTRTEDVIYGRKYGTALTLDVFTPKQNRNGAAVIYAISGGLVSSHDFISGAFQNFIDVYLKRGYTVFAVVHGSQPEFTAPDIIADMHRAIRYIRHHAQDYGVDPKRFGITGASSGGYLSLMQGTNGDDGKPTASDPVERESSRVQAVACFCPPSDFLNYGKSGEVALGCGVLRPFKPAFDFKEFDDRKKAFVRVTDVGKILEIGRQISPVSHVTQDDAATLIMHGDADTLVPIQQAQILIDKLQSVNVNAQLVTKPGAGHSWPDMLKDSSQFADWFDKYLPAAGQ